VGRDLLPRGGVAVIQILAARRLVPGRGLRWRRGRRVAVRWRRRELDVVEDLAGRSGRVYVEVDSGHGLAGWLPRCAATDARAAAPGGGGR
jgi:hypothetical protein